MNDLSLTLKIFLILLLVPAYFMMFCGLIWFFKIVCEDIKKWINTYKNR